MLTGFPAHRSAEEGTEDHRSQGGLDNSQSQSANVFRVDDPRSQSRVLHELTMKKMAEDAENDIAIRSVHKND